MKIAVVGAGITGLAAAHRCMELAAEQGIQCEITIFESNNRLGGVIKTERPNGYVMEFGPDSIFAAKPAAVDLCRRLGIEEQLISCEEKNRRSLVARNGRLHELPEGFVMLAPAKLMPFFKTTLFSPLGKIRMALDLLLRGKFNQTDQTDESVASFIIRRFGVEALERVAQPMVGGIYVGDVNKLSARATIENFVNMEREFGSIIRALMMRQTGTTSGARYSMFVSLDRGIGSLIETLETKIGSHRIKMGTAVRDISRAARGSWNLKFNDEEETFDTVIFSTPAPKLSAIVNQTDATISQALSRIEFASSAVVNLVYGRQDFERALDAFGFVVPVSEKRSILAASFASLKFPNRAAADEVVIRVFLGGVFAPDMLQNSDDDLVRMASQDLEYYLGVRSKPREKFVSRWPSSMPQYNVGHLELVDSLEKRLKEVMPGVFFAGNSYRGVGIPDCIVSGERAAAMAIEYGKTLSHQRESNTESVIA